jgi:hypothetical protein
MLLLVVLVLSVTRYGSSKRLLAVFRPRSRHTSSVLPLSHFTLPHLEFNALSGTEEDNGKTWQGRPHPFFEDSFYRDMFQVLEVSGAPDPALGLATLLVGLFEVLDEGEPPDISKRYPELAEQISRGSGTVVVASQPHLTRQEESSFRGTFCLGGSSNEIASQKQDKDDLYTFSINVGGGDVVVTRRILTGLASPAHPRSLPVPSAHRRPSAGVLGKFSLSRLPFVSPTAMEPELGLIMASFARAHLASVILDPFAGCGSILLAAATLQAKWAPSRSHAELIAVDIDLDASRMLENFSAVGLPPPARATLCRADSLGLLRGGEGSEEGDLSTLTSRLLGTVDCIITDPPYGIKEALRGNNSNDETPVKVVLGMAERLLRPGGRCAFWTPAVLNQRYEPIPLPPCSSLRLVLDCEQTLSPTLSRRLVVVEKNSKGFFEQIGQFLES